MAFAGGYLVPWIGFSAAATLLQWALLEWRLVSPMMEASNPWLAAGLLVLAGGYQFTRSKWACLERCSVPMAFLVREWRPRATGAALMGVLHGAFCVGCCWALMLLLFVLGVMNLLWVVALTLLVLAEKTLGRRRWVPWVSGVALCVWGLWLLGWGAAK